MPQRSNLFQKVVYLLQSQLADGATVSESAMLPDLITGTLREVDVHIVGSMAGQRLAISIECRDHKRKQGVGWVDEMWSKHKRLDTNALILVSSSGFTKGAEELSERYNIVLSTPEEPDESTKRKIVGKLGSLWYKEFSLTAKQVRVWFDVSDADVPTPTSEMLVDEKGKDIAPVWSLANELLNDRGLRANAMRDAVGDEDYFYMGAIFEPHEYEEDGLKAPFMRATLNGTEQLLRVKQIEVGGDATVRVLEVPLKHGVLGDVPFSYGEGEEGDRKLLMVVNEKREGQPTTTIQMTVAAGSTVGGKISLTGSDPSDINSPGAQESPNS